MVARFRVEPYRVPRTLPRVQFGAWSSQFCMECRISHATGNNLLISLSLWWTSDHSLFVLQLGLWCSDVWAAWCAGKLYHLQPTNKLVPPRYWLEDLLSTQVRPMVAAVDVNNHPVHGSLILSADWCSTLRCDSHGLLGQEEWDGKRNHKYHTQCWVS
jgi:hypothetical protein